MFLNLKAVFAAIVLAIMIGGVVLQHYFVVNTSPSFPLGVYRKTYAKAQRGDLVLACPPDRQIFHEAMHRHLLSAGFCPSGSVPLIKRLVATGGAAVSITEHGVFINGECLENSQRQNLKLTDMVKVPVERLLTQEEIVLMSPHPNSFDARYFGILPVSAIVTPLTR